MRLLFDQNLSPKLTNLLKDLYPDSQHVHTIGLAEVDDRVVWEYARDNGFIIYQTNRGKLILNITIDELAKSCKAQGILIVPVSIKATTIINRFSYTTATRLIVS